jgi:hypothetical protein
MRIERTIVSQALIAMFFFNESWAWKFGGIKEGVHVKECLVLVEYLNKLKLPGVL